MTDPQEVLRSFASILDSAPGQASLLERLIARLPGMLLLLERPPGQKDFHTTYLGGDNLATLLGYDIADYRGRTDFWRSIVHPEDLERMQREGSRVSTEGAADISPHRVRRKDGTVAWVEGHLVLAPGDDSTPTRIYGILIDISARFDAERKAQAALEQERLLRQRLDGFVTNVPGVVWENYFEQDPTRHRVNYTSPLVEKITGYTVEDWCKPTFWLDTTHPDDREQAQEDAKRTLEQGSGSTTYRWITKDGRTRWVVAQMTTILDETGAPIGLRGVTLDMTDVVLAQAERTEMRMRETALQAQTESLLALSTPLMPINDEIMAMPLVGAIDPQRAERVLQTLLDGVAQNRAKVVILDVTGVPEMDEQTADALLKAARAVSLLGAEVILTGIRPDVARILVEIATEIGSIVTQSTLKAGIAYAMQRK